LVFGRWSLVFSLCFASRFCLPSLFTEAFA